MSVIRRAASNLKEQRGASGYLPWGDSVPPDNSMLGGSAAGVQVTEKTAMQIGAVFGSVSLISDALATLPVKVLQVQKGKTAVEIDTPPVIAQPFSEISPIDFTVQGISSLLLRGNFFGQVISRDPKTLKPTQIMPIHPDRAKVRRLESGKFEWRFNGEVVAAQNVTISRALSMSGSILGLDPISALRNQFGLAHAQDLFAGAFFSNSAQPEGVIEIAGDLDDEQTLKLARGWNQNHQGIGKSFLPGVLTGGAVWKPVTVTPQNAQFLEQMQYSASYISGTIFRVPPHMLGMVERSTSWGNGIEQQEQGFVTNTLLGWIRRWEYLLTTWLPANQIAMLDLSHRLRGDTLQRWQSYQTGRVVGAISNAEIRDAENMPLVSDEDLLGPAYTQPLNSAPMKAGGTSSVGPGGDGAN